MGAAVIGSRFEHLRTRTGLIEAALEKPFPVRRAFPREAAAHRRVRAEPVGSPAEPWLPEDSSYRRWLVDQDPTRRLRAAAAVYSFSRAAMTFSSPDRQPSRRVTNEGFGMLPDRDSLITSIRIGNVLFERPGLPAPLRGDRSGQFPRTGWSHRRRLGTAGTA
jgi:hypothetical protein